MKTRKESDSLGEIDVPINALWGAQTQRSLQNFKIGSQTFPKEFIHCYAQLKKAAAIVNGRYGKLSESQSRYIVLACDEIISEKYNDAFPLAIWQTGSGTQTNMNLNEVIANRANELAGSQRGSNNPIHPNDHVNMAQSSNDTFPSAMHITAATITHQWLLPALDHLLAVLTEKQTAFSDLIKSGRTHMMDATPITLGQEFSAYHDQILFSKNKIIENLDGVYALAIGGTAVGTGLNTTLGWAQDMTQQITQQTGLTFTPADNKFSALASHDALTHLHGSLTLLATNVLKIGNDLRLMASGPRCGLNEIQIPANEPVSSIMPGKVNPTQIEALTMVAIQVMGNNTAVSIANSQGQFQLNVYKPLILRNVFESIRLLSDAINSFTDHCLSGLIANTKQLTHNLENTLMLVTALAPKIGYDNAAKVAKLAFEKGLTLKQATQHFGLLSEKEFDELVDPKKMLGPIAGPLS